MEALLTLCLGGVFGIVWGADTILLKYKKAAEEHKAIEIAGKVYRLVEVEG
jgi:hypothetical protein